MIAAMMAPLTIAPLRPVAARSLPQRRRRAVTVLLAGYGIVWGGTGLALAVLSTLGGSVSTTVVVVGVAAVWQASPGKQVCLNRTHAKPRLSAFGRAGGRRPRHVRLRPWPVV